MKNVILIVACVVLLCMPALVAAQTGNDKPKTTGTGHERCGQDPGD